MRGKRHEPRGDSRPRLSGGATPRCRGVGKNGARKKAVELRSTGEPRAAVPTWLRVVSCTSGVALSYET